MNEKLCPKCEQNLPVSSFAKDKSRKDGLQTYCKSCHYEMVARYESTQAGKETKRRYRQSPKGKASKRRRHVRYSQKDENRKKRNARKAVTRRISSGVIPSASELDCADCNNQAEHYHHEDYNKALDVIPLCVACHQKRHD